MKLANPRVLLLLLVLAFFVVFLAIVSTTQPVYAGNRGGLPPQMITPGDEGGPPLPPNTIEGRVTNYQTGHVIQGMNVYLNFFSGLSCLSTTDSNGWFKFAYPNPNCGIYPNMRYYLSVNGEPINLGGICDDRNYGQWEGDVFTDNQGHAWKTVNLEPVTLVDVTAAALFSNTKYASLYYESVDGHTVSHNVGFGVALGIGYSIGYSTSDTVTENLIFICYPLEAVRLTNKYRAVTYYDAIDGCVRKTGLGGRAPGWDYELWSTQEYLSISNISESYYDKVGCDNVPPFTKEYEETGSVTWTQGMPFGINYHHFGVNLNVEITLTTAQTNKVAYTINRRIDNNPAHLLFAVYTAGHIYSKDTGRGGMELHIWDLSGAG